VGDRRAGPERTGARGPGTPRGKRPAAAPARTPTEDDRPTEVTPPLPRRSVTRRTKVTRHTRRTFGRAMGAALAATVVPGSGLLMINRKRAGGLVLGVFLLAVVALVIIGFTARRAALVQNLLSSRVLLVVMVGLVLAALAWITQIVRTYALARPRMLDPGRRVVGVVLVAALCLLVASPFGYAAQLVNSQRSLLDNLFGGGGGTSVAEAIAKPRLNVLLVGSDAGPDRTGARTDTMMLASIDTTTARTTLFALPRNIGYAQFPPGTPMAEKFPKGFHDAASPLSGDYLLNAVYAWGLDHPADAPTTPTANPGLNLLHETVAYMLGVDIDYYVEVNMAGLTSIIDAVGGVTVDVGPTPLPIGGVLPDGRHVRPSGYVPAGVQHLDGDQALWFARSRRDSDDYSRMGRQRCLLQSMLQQKSPADVITRFQDIAAATSNSVATNIPQEVLGALVALAGDKPLTLQSISFDPNLPDPNERDGRFNTSRVDVSYMREVVQNAFAAPAPAPPPTTTQAPPTTASRRAGATPTPTVAPTAAPAQLACGS
jgi:polyisoprenyl-teichoic acid--peptidoglycan teichoic acid transferase